MPLDNTDKNVYYPENGDAMKLSEHFDSEEFRCNCNRRHSPPWCDGFPAGGIDPALVALLEEIRTACGDRPITINSGYRCERYNDTPKSRGGVGGARSSQHKLGTAADFTVKGMSPHEVHRICKRIMNARGTGGLGYYPNFTHVDVRRNKARW